MKLYFINEKLRIHAENFGLSFEKPTIALYRELIRKLEVQIRDETITKINYICYGIYKDKLRKLNKIEIV